MTVRERFEKVRQEQRNRFSLRTRLTALVTLEMLVCVLVAYGLDLLLNKVLPIQYELHFVHYKVNSIHDCGAVNSFIEIIHFFKVCIWNCEIMLCDSLTRKIL